MIVYLDSSVVAKLLLDEDATPQIRDSVRTMVGDGARLISSQLLHTEVHRVAFREALDPRSVDQVLNGLHLHSPTVGTLRRAASFRFHVKTLDAIHLATAVELDLPDLALFSLDHQMLRGAETLSIPLIRPRTEGGWELG